MFFKDNINGINAINVSNVTNNTLGVIEGGYYITLEFTIRELYFLSEIFFLMLYLSRRHMFLPPFPIIYRVI